MLTDIGMIGLAVMGENLALNMESKGFAVSVYDVRPGVVEKFVQGRGAGKRFYGAESFEDLVRSLTPPRKIMMMIRAGSPVDEVIDKLLPLLSPGDVIIDGGNSHFPDTARRVAYVESKGMRFIGTGVSGGEEGALKGPSMMPGGSQDAWLLVKDILQSICAKSAGAPCCEWVGAGGAGHFVKMVHNGIEYGDMQLICESYQLMRDALGMGAEEMRAVFAKWNEGALSSYLIQITRDILGYKDDAGAPLVDSILDTAGQKGTGKWAAIAALDEGEPLTLIGEAVFARCLSAMKDARVKASGLLSGPSAAFEGDKAQFLADLESALLASKIVSYAQGFSLMRAAAKSYGWALNYGDIALMWRGGCIIRSVFLGDIKRAFDQDPALDNLMLAPYFKDILEKAQSGWRSVLATAIRLGVPAPAMTAAVAYYDGYRAARLPANLLQAQRDYFGAHTYERLDAPRGQFFHTDWAGLGGDTASTTYTV